MQGSYLGPEYSQKEIEKQLDQIGAKYKIFKDHELIDIAATDLSKEEAIGWFQGRMEFGPRALGARSILGDPRSEKMQKNLNLKVKYRESFRPFAPSILKEDLSEWFDINVDSPYMLMVANINENKIINMTEDQKNLFGIDKLNVKRTEIPAVNHVDYSARIQTVHKETNEKYYKDVNPIEEKSLQSKLDLLKEVNNYTRAKGGMVKQVTASFAGEHKSIEIIRSGGEVLTDVRPLIRFNVSVMLEKDGKKETGVYGIGGRQSYD